MIPARGDLASLSLFTMRLQVSADSGEGQESGESTVANEELVSRVRFEALQG